MDVNIDVSDMNVVVKVVVVGVAVDDTDVVDVGGVRPPQAQAPSVLRGICEDREVNNRAIDAIP
jgi:hypothetical protein